MAYPVKPDEANYTAWAYNIDGTDRFTTVYPQLNLLDGTKDFSGDWINSEKWITDGKYNGLTVKKRSGQYNGIYKPLKITKDGDYSFSIYVKSSGSDIVKSWVNKNGVDISNKDIGSNFDWKRDTYTLSLKAGDVIHIRYELPTFSGNSEISVAGYKWGQGSTATPYMPSYSEATIADYPSYIGTYTGKIVDGQSTDPVKYNWKKI